ncbi:MAG TPA: hypothetical protein VLE73_05710 [Candidatus Saccharimonadales bacterium]|nr:hypothetical protein [Candidatus Saccharimonadales bacterium]
MADDTQLDDQAARPDPFQNRDDGFFSPRRDEPHLPQDFNPPASSPEDVHTPNVQDIPAGDTNIDSAERYDEGDFSATDTDAQEGN